MKTMRIIAIIFALAFSVCSYALISGTTGGFEPGSGYTNEYEDCLLWQNSIQLWHYLKVLCNNCHVKD
jgi:hypothetical protein